MPAEFSQVKSDRRPFAGRLDAAYDRRATPERYNRQPLSPRNFEDFEHLFLRLRPHDHIGRLGHFAATDTDEVFVAFSEAEADAVGDLSGHALLANGATQLRGDAVGQAAGRQCDIGEGLKPWRRVRIAQTVAKVGPEPLRVRQVVRLAFPSPPPPLGSHA